MTTDKARPNAAGRSRKNASYVLRKLLKVTQECFVAEPVAAVSVRPPAQCAEVSTAMVQYYFDRKAGFYMTLFEETVDSRLLKEGLDLCIYL